jgi:hypothetical protein
MLANAVSSTESPLAISTVCRNAFAEKSRALVGSVSRILPLWSSMRAAA